MKKAKNVVKFSRLLFVAEENFDYVLELEVNGELRLWYNNEDYQGFNAKKFQENTKFSLEDKCILQDFEWLDFLFYNSPITEFNIDLPNLTSARYMFENCKKLVSFESKMEKLEDTKGMFRGCSKKFLRNNKGFIPKKENITM